MQITWRFLERSLRMIPTWRAASPEMPESISSNSKVGISRDRATRDLMHNISLLSSPPEATFLMDSKRLLLFASKRNSTPSRPDAFNAVSDNFTCMGAFCRHFHLCFHLFLQGMNRLRQVQYILQLISEFLLQPDQFRGGTDIVFFKEFISGMNPFIE